MRRRQAVSKLDPRTANVGFLLLGEPTGAWTEAHREYYWYDPAWNLHAIYDDEFREQHPELSDEEWHQLFSEASLRGERDFDRAMDVTPTDHDLTVRPDLGGGYWAEPSVRDSRLPRLLDERQLAEELNITRAASLAIMRRVPKVNHPADLRKVYVKESDVLALLEEATAG